MAADQLRVEDRILLHLQAYIRFADDYEVPRAMSQKGIAEAVWVAWSNVPRAMKKMRGTGLVDERTARVKGEFRKKKVYVLTPLGFAKAQELREDLGRRMVNVSRGGETREMAFAEVPEYVGFKVPYLELLRGVDEDGHLDVERAQTRWEEQVEMVDRTERAPKVHTFFGREEELRVLGGMVSDHRFVIVHGIAGIGKTSLVATSIDHLRKGTNVLWIPVHHWDTLSGVLGQMADFLAEAGRRQLRSLLDDSPSPVLEDAYYSLEEDMRDLKGVIVLDDFHKACGPVVDLMSMVLEIIKDRSSPTFMLVSRHLPSFYDRRYVVVQRAVGEMALEGLDRAAARAMLDGRGLTEEEFASVYDTTQGHPLALELLMHRGDVSVRPFKDVMAFVREEVFENLTEEERVTLSAISVHRSSFPREAALAAASSTGRGPQVLDSLTERGLVSDVGEEELRLHDLVREFFASRLTTEEREAHHREAAEVWGRPTTPKGPVERAYHLQMAGESEAAVATLAENARGILSEPSLLRDVLGTLEAAASCGTLSPPALDEIDLLRADALAQLDQLDAAQALYTRVLDRAVAEGERGQEARVLHRLGRLHLHRHQPQEALEVTLRSVEAFDEVKDEAGSAEGHLTVATALLEMDRVEQAEEELGMAHESYTLVEDLHGVAEACVRIASIHLDREDAEVARNYLEEALDNLDPKQDTALLSRTYYLLGDTDRIDEDWEKVVENHGRALELFQALGDEQMMANTCTALGDAFMALGDEERADLFYQRGLDLMVAQ